MADSPFAPQNEDQILAFTRADRAAHFAELKHFAESFKLATPTPPDLIRKTSKADPSSPGSGLAGAESPFTCCKCGAIIDTRNHNVCGGRFKTTDFGGRYCGHPKCDLCEPWSRDQLDQLQTDPTAAAPSTIYAPSLSAQTRGTRDTHSTAPTSISDPSSRKDSWKQPGIGRATLGDIQEQEEENVLLQPKDAMLPEPGEGNGVDGHSIASQGSTTYTPGQRNDVALRMAQAVLKKLRRDSKYHAVNDSSRQHILPHLTSALKEFAETVEVDPSIQIEAKAMRMVRRLRSQIAKKLHESVLGLTRGADVERTPIEIVGSVGEMRLQDIMSLWDATNPELLGQHEPKRPDMHESTMGFPGTHAPSMPSSSLSVRSWSADELSVPENDANDVYGTPAIDPASILHHFAVQPAFQTLVGRTEKLFERYHSEKMDLIRLRTSLAIRRPTAGSSGHTSLALPARAVFHVEWDLRSFLVENYDSGIGQDLDRILAVTGDADKAQLCSVGKYFEQSWPTCNSELLRAIRVVLSASSSSNGTHSLPPPTQAGGSVVVDATLKLVSVEGGEDFIISVAQQLSWLAAACQEKRDYRTYAYVGFSEADISTQVDVPTFNIDVKLEEAPSQASGDCWNMLVGPAVLITGFPIPERHHGEQGLEISIANMAALARIPQAVSFGGGVVLKGRCQALVPTASLGPSTQWHIIDTRPKRLDWSHIDEVCPERLRENPDETGLWDSRSFLGWCATSFQLLGTALYNYKDIGYSNAGKPPKWAQVDKFAVGFSQWGIAQVDGSVGRRDGFARREASDYESLLVDARGTHVILHDTDSRRAYQTNAEDLILHIVHHRRANNPSTTQPLLETEKSGSTISFAHPNRGVRTTHDVMIENAEKVVSNPRSLKDGKPSPRFFVNEVDQLWSSIDGLWASTYVPSGGKQSIWKFDLKNRLKHGQNACGWEYMDLWKATKHMDPKSVQLRKTCGKWNDYAEDIQALVLFGAKFGDLMKPMWRNQVCPAFSSVPPENCYLAVPARTVETLCVHHGPPKDQAMLTSSGLALNGSEKVFQVRNYGTQTQNVECNSRHLLRLVTKSKAKKGKEGICLDSYRDGAIIIGGT